MNPSKISSVIQKGISERVFPGAVVYIVEGGNLTYFEASGHRMIEPAIKLMQRDTIFDLASLTKPIVIPTLIMHLAESSDLDLHAPIQYHLPEFAHREVTILHLLTHTSGLPAWRALYLETGSNDQVVSLLGQMSLENPPGEHVEYSCLGYILLGKFIERITGSPIDRLAEEQIFQPLDMPKTRYNPPGAWTDTCAATEDSSSFEKRMVNYQRHDWREGVIVGVVHDENAHFLGGISGNSGLFSTAADVGKFCQMLIDGGDGVLTGKSILQMATVHTKGLNESRSIGWIILEDGSLYHTGFTGTSIRVNLEKNSFVILLTNRVHPSAFGPSMVDFRAKFHQKFLPIDFEGLRK